MISVAGIPLPLGRGVAAALSVAAAACEAIRRGWPRLAILFARRRSPSGVTSVMSCGMLSDPALAHLSLEVWCEPDPTLVSRIDTR